MTRSIFHARRKAFSAGLAAAFLALVCSPAAMAEGGGAVGGSARFEGPRPERKPIEMKEGTALQRGENLCAKLHATAALEEDQIVGEKGEVANVFVYVKEGLAKKDYPLPAESAKLDQQKCLYVPHVQGVRVGQKLEIHNGDTLMHNIRSFAKKNPAFNIGQPDQGVREKTFHKAENAIKIKCDVHKWMTAYIFAMDHPYYAVTGENGAFKIEGLPEGEYTIAAWHEVYGEQTQKVKVGASGEAKAEFVFKPKK